MLDFFIRIILIALTILGIVFFIKKNEKYKLLTNNIFWICISWLVCLILYYFSGIKYTIKLNILALLYIFIILGLFISRTIPNNKNKHQRKENRRN